MNEPCHFGAQGFVLSALRDLCATATVCHCRIMRYRRDRHADAFWALIAVEWGIVIGVTAFLILHPPGA